MEGALSKWTNVMKGWQYRWFVLDDNAGLFSYYTSKEKMRRGVRRGCVRLRGAVVGIDDEDDSTFTVTVDNKTFHFQAKDSEERERWIRALEDTVQRHNQLKRRSASSNRKTGVKMEDFDRKLAETDAYLQLLIDQKSSLEDKAAQSCDDSTKEQYTSLMDRVNDMVETVKHAIVLLQIAKNASCPIEGEGLAMVHSEGATPRLQVKNGDTGSLQEVLSDAIIDGVEEGSECREQGGGGGGGGPGAVSKQHNTLSYTTSPRSSVPSHLKNVATIPAISYSSSDDDDDDFYDAEDDILSAGKGMSGGGGGGVDGGAGDAGLVMDPQDLHLRATTPSNPYPPTQVPAPTPANLTPVSPLTPSEVDWDNLYEEEEEESEVDMKSHGSVITHLLSQVRIGMDLTKIVLPTFILERRSLLEMYADFFAHPDIFVEIPKKSTPEERMIQVLKWYLSSFHASRKSSVAKKPYNPILGEMFRCHWSLPETGEEGNDSPIPGIPIPWCNQNDLVFLAEQVSHHPPISAFYVECGAHRISFNGHIYTKSSFLGVSVAVHNLGEGRVSLLDTGEDYVVTFPSGYGRGILTTPWLELGGKCEITCPQTGCRSEIEFKCKQFWSNEQNKITAEVFSRDSKKSIVKVDGEWNGKMMGKWAATGKTETFLDVTQLPVTKKNVKPVAEQEKYESRRLWREVTAGLKFGDIEAATEAKCSLEQKQRTEAKARKEEGVKWENRMFNPIGENWHFTQPLGARV